jgi:hypothetical protein
MRGGLAAVRRAAGLAVKWLGRQETIVLLAALAVGLGLFAVIKIAEEVVEGGTPDFDVRLLRLLRQPDNPALPIGPLWLLEVAQDITALGGRTAAYHYRCGPRLSDARAQIWRHVVCLRGLRRRWRA